MNGILNQPLSPVTPNSVQANVYGQFMQQIPQYPQLQLPKQYDQAPPIVTIGGREAIDKLNLPPNTKAWWLDMNGKTVWVTETDGVGYKTGVEAYDLVPHVNPPTTEEKMAENQAKVESQMNDILQALTGITERLEKVENSLTQKALIVRQEG